MGSGEVSLYLKILFMHSEDAPFFKRREFEAHLAEVIGNEGISTEADGDVASSVSVRHCSEALLPLWPAVPDEQTGAKLDVRVVRRDEYALLGQEGLELGRVPQGAIGAHQDGVQLEG